MSSLSAVVTTHMGIQSIGLPLEWLLHFQQKPQMLYRWGWKQIWMMGANLGQTHVGPLLGDCIQPMTYSPIFSSLGSRKVLSATETWIGCFQDLCYLYLMLSSHVFKKITGSLCWHLCQQPNSSRIYSLYERETEKEERQTGRRWDL